MTEHERHSQQTLMTHILDIRYTDLEAEKTLCLELLAWAEAHGDLYALAFAHIYLGDSLVAEGDGPGASVHLEEGLRLLEPCEKEFPMLSIRCHSLYGICQELQSNEHSAVESYLKAIVLARAAGDESSVCMALNNLAVILHRYHCYDEACNYYESAYTLCKSMGDERLRPFLMSNLLELYVNKEQLDLAGECLEEYEKNAGDDLENDALYARASICYHSARGDAVQAVRWADWVLAHSSFFNESHLTAFDNYNLFCGSMLRIHKKDYALRFLQMMERTNTGKLSHVKALGEKKMEFCLQFEPESEHAQAYHDYYKTTREYRKQSNQATVNAMKAKIDLDNAITQQKKLQSEHEKLKKQVDLDELTQIYNRRYLDKMTRKFAQEEALGISAIMVDVDYFKEYNDYYGHVKGDNVLKVVAECLEKCRVPGVIPCRYGGDEFVCLCEGMCEDHVKSYIQAVRTALMRRAISHEKSHCSSYVTLSIGYACGSANQADDPYFVMQLADQALYGAKTTGRDTYQGKRVRG